MGSLLLKGGVAAVTAGTLITGAAVVQLQSGGHRHHVHPGVLAASPQSGTPTTSAGAAVADASTPSSASAGPGGISRASSKPAAHTRYASLGSAGSAEGLHEGGAGAPVQRGAVVVRPHSLPTAPGSTTDATAPTVPTTSAGSVPSSSTSDQSSSNTGSGGVSVGGLVGSGAGAGSSGGSGAEAPTGGNAGSGQQAPAGSESAGSTPSGSGGESSGAQSSSGSGSAGSEQSGGLVKTVVHEVGSVVEHLLH